MTSRPTSTPAVVRRACRDARADLDPGRRTSSLSRRPADLDPPSYVELVETPGPTSTPGRRTSSLSRRPGRPRPPPSYVELVETPGPTSTPAVVRRACRDARADLDPRPSYVELVETPGPTSTPGPSYVELVETPGPTSTPGPSYVELVETPGPTSTPDPVAHLDDSTHVVSTSSTNVGVTSPAPRRACRDARADLDTRPRRPPRRQRSRRLDKLDERRGYVSRTTSSAATSSSRVGSRTSSTRVERLSCREPSRSARSAPSSRAVPTSASSWRRSMSPSV